MSRRRELKPERDENGRPIYARVTTLILGENYNWAVRHGAQFGSLLDAAIRERRGLSLPKDPLRAWLAKRNREGLLTSPEELAAKKAELEATAEEPRL